MTARHLSKTQNSKIFFGYVDSNAKIFLILYPPPENSTTCIVKMCYDFRKSVFHTIIMLYIKCKFKVRFKEKELSYLVWQRKASLIFNDNLIKIMFISMITYTTNIPISKCDRSHNSGRFLVCFWRNLIFFKLLLLWQ